MTSAVKKIYPDQSSLIRHLAEWLTARIENSSGPFALALSGGSTPRPLYALLATPDYARRIDWARLHLFWGDERCVPHDHPDSNYRMVKQALIAHVPLPQANVHAVQTGLTPQAAARDYALRLQAYYGAEMIDPARPLFDVNLLGMGDDGHTASLFPGTAALTEEKAWVVAVEGVKPEPRISLTFPVLGSAAAVVFLVAGAAKSKVVEEVLNGDLRFPAAQVQTDGDLLWFMDEAAGGKPCV
ncbi:6-phosphogluconolactonase [Herbaspirillum sp. RTI4]|uniref:6-phosphogluconolactonase n=1 Tax=Herbaspirillum sp. RTI4 TaxID=3048640 RepID=UPI002AB49A27|nr:6-phosphogluconolactonase [Herbaspirillum sp. RTI4]MDY7578111.1 6-phosphogluconolactonase [Herbaspirillum sp. RTI4]MEA9980700.1 6-phosphogluconolactonase [Herbaspirillum sp. RTI4]